MSEEVDQFEDGMMSGSIPRIEATTADERVFVLEHALKVMVDSFCSGNTALEAKYRAETYAHNGAKNTIATLRRQIAELEYQAESRQQLEADRNWQSIVGANKTLFARVKELEAELAEANRKLKLKSKHKRRK